MRIRDCFWIWGHHAGAHHTGEAVGYNIPGENKMGPWEGAEYLGIPNCCRVVFNGIPNLWFTMKQAETFFLHL